MTPEQAKAITREDATFVHHYRQRCHAAVAAGQPIPPLIDRPHSIEVLTRATDVLGLHAEQQIRNTVELELCSAATKPKAARETEDPPVEWPDVDCECRLDEQIEAPDDILLSEAARYSAADWDQIAGHLSDDLNDQGHAMRCARNAASILVQAARAAVKAPE